MKTSFFTNGYLLPTYEVLAQPDTLVATVAFGTITNDESNRWPKGHRVLTSAIEIFSESECAAYTKSGSRYEFDNPPERIEISTQEWLLMRDDGLGPSQILTLRRLSKTMSADDSRKH